MDKKVLGRTVAYLRKQFSWSPQYRAVKKRCFIMVDFYQCEGCGHITTKNIDTYEYAKPYEDALNIHITLEQFHVDHIDPVGRLEGLDMAYERIFCPLSNLMGLCQTCHYWKTRLDNEDIRNNT